MRQRNSRSSARRLDRPVLAPDWLIALLTGMVAGGLWLLYPRQALENRLAEAADTPLSVAYLTNLLRSDPENPQLRLLLARHEILHGEMDHARATLEPALQSADPDIHGDALWALWELQHAQYLRIPEKKTEQRATQLAAMRSLLQTLAAETWPANRQRRLAALSMQFGDEALRAATLKEEALQEPQNAAAYYERTAREALGRGEYQASADLFILARSASTDPAQAKAYFHEALRTLRSGNLPAAALELGEREVGILADDPDTLYLLIEIARAAGKPAAAERYARRLLHLSLLQQWQGLQGVQQAQAPSVPLYDDGAHLLQSGMQTVALRTPAANAAPKAPLLPYDDKAYTTGYQVFLESGKPEDAWAVAHAAVQQAPDDMAWRERLAQVSEWTSRPEVALEQWLVLARRTQRDDAWQAVLRLAPGLLQDGALVEALRYRLRRNPNDITLLREFVDVQERLGEPGPALAYLREHARQPEALELLAWLAERAGDPGTALQTWRRLFTDPAQITPDRAMRAAVLALLHRRADEGLAWLEAAQKQLPTQAPANGKEAEQITDYWRLTGQVAESREQHLLAIHAFRELAKQPKAELQDLDALIRLLEPQHPLEAAQVALRTWEEHDHPRHLIQALTLYASRSEWAPFDRVLAALDPEPQAQRRSLQKLRAMPEFLRLMGTHFQNTGKLALAREYLQAGLALSPDSADMQSALLWLLIDSNDATALRELLTRNEVRWSRQADMHDALASSYQALSQPQIALERYLTPHLQEKQKDFLWMMNYADALDQNQQFDRAWQLRKHLLREQQKALADSQPGQRLTHAQVRQQWLTQAGLDATRRVARTRLVLSQNPGDEAHAVLRELLRLDLDSQGQLTNAAAEAAIGWLQDLGQYPAERRFLWQQYARSQSLQSNRPLWAEITVALAEDDRMAAGELLERFDERLPRYDRVNAARAVADERTAQTAAFETLHAQHDDQPLHLQLTESLLAFSDQARTSTKFQSMQGMNESQAGAAVHLAISPRLRMEFEWNSIQRRSTDTRIVTAPPQERLWGMRLHWITQRTDTRLGLARRDGWRSTTGWQLTHEHKLDQRLTLLADLGQHLPSEDSLGLRLAGMKDQAGVGLRYQISRLDHAYLNVQAEQFELQTGQWLGNARHAGLRYTHTYRQDLPQLEFSAFGSWHRYRLNNAPIAWPAMDFLPEGALDGAGSLLPQNFGFYGVEVASNMRLEQEYTRALQPFFSLSRTWHSQLGAGYGIRLGVAGSVLGADHFSIAWGLSKSGLQSQDLNREVQVRYRLHF